MNSRKLTETRHVLRWQAGRAARRAKDQLATEEPLEVRVNTRPVVVTMRTPGHDDELAAGFLLTEGLVRSATDIQRIAPYARNTSGNVLDVYLSPEVTVDFAKLTRHVFASSSCGLCGKASIESVQQHFDKVRSRLKLSLTVLRSLPEQLRKGQTAFEASGGLHAAAIFDLRGRMIVVREDVGRHNAVDKVLGFGLQHGLLPFDRHVLMVSGRASFEIMQKALAGGIPVVAAISEDYPGTLLDVRHRVPDDVHEVQRSLSLVAALGYRLPEDDEGQLRIRRPRSNGRDR